MLLVVCQLSRDGIGYDVIGNWCVSVRLLPELNSPLLASIFSQIVSSPVVLS